MATPIDDAKYNGTIMGYRSFQTGSSGLKQSWVWSLWVYSLFRVTKQLIHIIYDRNDTFPQIRHAGNAIIINYFGFSRFQVLETPYLRHCSSCIA